ncbi:ribonuclease HIII [Mycoplasmopsis alligatoris]|uniref:Ribonuclease n=1 Tax=Mycoplasmopsis alligatoris A21JP2 TaxID=747682 RepID=D4XVQ0_9BACT|nr:ribonuclease HIII [Mycoplasmopsis alligatoris]EFF41705.1 ribonuclease HII [Mycoplasmopsis alligatoris A21JP2]
MLNNQNLFVTKNAKILEYNSSFLLNQLNIIGVDETGVGDYFGPLVTAAVFIPNNLLEYFKNLGVKDSKLIKNEKQIHYLANEIKSKCYYKTYVLSNSGYNKIDNNYKNIHKLKFFAHSHAINSLEELLSLRNVKIDYIFIDQYTTLNAFNKYYDEIIILNNWSKINEFKSPILLAHKAESIHLSVAAASILARAELLDSFKKIKEIYNFDFLLGANQKVKNQVVEFKEKFGEEELKKVCKTNFKI